MGIMGFLRNRAGVILIGLIGFAIVSFLVGDVVRFGSPLWRTSDSDVGVVADEAISIQRFNDKIEISTNNIKQQIGNQSLNPAMMAYVVENTWNQLVSQILIDKESNRVGLQVSKNELNDLVTGKNPDPKIMQTFGNPKTGEIDRAELAAFLEKVRKQNPKSEMSKQWGSFLLTIHQNHLSKKYNEFIKNALYVTSLEANDDYYQRNQSANFNYVDLDYASISDQLVQVSDRDYEKYYDENKYRFDNPEESRKIQYVVFNVIPSKIDSANLKVKVDQLFAEFTATKNDSLFVGINSDTKIPVSYIQRGRLDQKIDALVFNAPKGALIGPIFSNGVYTMVKVLDTKISPDSVTASHILINPATEGGIEKAEMKADSIKHVIQVGVESFANLAAKYGTDASKENGGSLGTFGRGMMIPEFENLVFDGKKGDLRVVTTKFGVHVIRIDSQKGASKVVKVAFVDKALLSSPLTQREIYAKASDFLSHIIEKQSLSKQAKKMNYRALLAENVSPNATSVQGIDNPREMIRWAYKAAAGDVSKQIFETNNQLVVARLLAIHPKGKKPLKQVKKEIESFVLNQAKSKILLDKMNQALVGASSIDQVAKKLDRSVLPVKNMLFANPVLSGGAQEPKLVGTVFGSKPHQLSKAIAGDHGVYVFVLDELINPNSLSNVFKQKKQIMQGLSRRCTSDAYYALMDYYHVKDNRIRFF